jgi:hypothetical protein
MSTGCSIVLNDVNRSHYACIAHVRSFSRPYAIFGDSCTLKFVEKKGIITIKMLAIEDDISSLNIIEKVTFTETLY